MNSRLLFLLFSTLLAGCDVKVFITGEGSVTTSDATIAQCDSAPACFSVDRGTTITLQATADDGYVFAGWGGACENESGLTCALSVTDERRVQATFLPQSGGKAKALMQPETEYFFTAPWPNDAYSLRADGTLDIERMPLPKKGIWDEQLQKMAKRTHGFGTHAGVFFQAIISYEAMRLFEQYYSPTYYEDDVGYFLDIDTQSPHFGRTTPARMKMHLSAEDISLGISQPLETRALFMLEPQPGYSLRSGSRYAAIMTTASSLSPAEMLARLDQPYDPRLGFSQVIFDALREQKQTIVSALANTEAHRIDDISAFTVFTAQNPKVTDHAIKTTLKQISDDEIIQRTRVEGWDTMQCNPAGYTDLTIHTSAPNFLTGKSLFLWGGGDIEIVNDQAIIQNEQPLELKVYLPCTPSDKPLPLIVHAHYTGNWGLEEEFGLRNAINVFLTAPEAGERRSDSIDNVLKFLKKMGFYAGDFVDYLVDFNLFNLTAAKNQHIQYGSDLAFALRVAKLLPQIMQVAPSVDQRMFQYNSDVVTLSGWSLGGVVTLHALAQGADADVVTTLRAPRPSVMHFDNLMRYLDEQQPGLSEKLLNYVGVKSGYSTQPALQVLQTVLEPMDTLNYIDELTDIKFAWMFSNFDDSLHGGDAAYSMARAMHRELGATPVHVGEMNVDGWRARWDRFGINVDPIGMNELDNLQTRSLQLMLTQDDEAAVINITRCFPHALTKENVNLGYAANPSGAHYYIDCSKDE